MSVVRMSHPRLGPRDVPERAVGKYKQNGWRLAQREPQKQEAEAPDSSGAFLLPEHEEGAS